MNHAVFAGDFGLDVGDDRKVDRLSVVFAEPDVVLNFLDPGQMRVVAVDRKSDQFGV